LPQLPLGQKLMLARRGSTRIAAGLVAHGPEQVARMALDNSFLTESQLLKTLAKTTLTARIVAAVANHDKWSKLVNVRVALLRHPQTPPDRVPTLVTGLPRREIEDLLELSRLPEDVRSQLREELTLRKNGSC
jgi:predicted MPP superfamily phosphohydrolase